MGVSGLASRVSFRWLNQLSAPFLWVMLTPIVTVPLSIYLFIVLAGYHEPEEIGLPSKASHEYFEVGPTLMAFTLPGLLNLVPFAWALAPKPRVRIAGIVAGLLGLLRLLIPPTALLLFFNRVTNPEGTSFFEYDTFRLVAPPPPYIEIWILGFLAWLGSRVAWGTLEWATLSAESADSALESMQRGQRLNMEGQYEEALVEFNKAIWLNPELAPAWKERASAYAQLGDAGQAIADLEKALSLTGDPAARTLIAASIDALRGRWRRGR